MKHAEWNEHVANVEAREKGTEEEDEGAIRIFTLTPPEEEPEVNDRFTLADINVEKLEALSEVYGVSEDAIVNMAISDLFDGKIGAVREAEGD
jgi:hypothetical protein